MPQKISTQDRSPEWTPYVLDNAASQTPARFTALAELYDDASIRHLERTGVQGGWDCWEIGAGPGSIARWLAARVRPAGTVLATDIDTRFLQSIESSGVRVLRHDIVLDPLPEQRFDLIHARLLLVHLPEREAVLDRLIAALKPGGCLLLEEFDSTSAHAAPDRFPREVALKSGAAFRKVMIGRGVDAEFGRALAGHLASRGMQDLFAEGRLLMCQGRSAGARLMKANLEQLREAILATGQVTDSDFEDDLARLEQDDYLAPLPVMWSVSARKAVVA